MLFGIEATYEITAAIGVFASIVYFAINALSANLGGYFQNCATIIKMIPLVIIAVAGFLYGDPYGAMPIETASKEMAVFNKLACSSWTDCFLI